jgi:hypothetical protein
MKKLMEGLKKTHGEAGLDEDIELEHVLENEQPSIQSEDKILTCFQYQHSSCIPDQRLSHIPSRSGHVLLLWRSLSFSRSVHLTSLAYQFSTFSTSFESQK